VFFFQAEDGIRDRNVTGVQTCALPIYRILGVHLALRAIAGELEKQRDLLARASKNGEEEAVRKEIKAQIEKLEAQRERLDRERRSEERRVGEEGRRGGGTGA